MIAFGILLLIFSAVYASFIFWCFIGWKLIDVVPYSSNKEFPGVTVIVPVRNEERTIAVSLQALVQQDYPKHKIEILVVDDHSDDKTTVVVNEFIRTNPGNGIRLIEMATNEFGSKKSAITKAVSEARFEIILTTDGDCIVPVSWIRTFVHAYQESDIEFVAGPVAFHSGAGLLGSFQALEMLGLVGIAAAGIRMGNPLMCNGANISYTKAAFVRVNGFESLKQHASGDDTQLLLKIAKQDKSKVVFLKQEDSIVLGTPVHSLSQLWQQRKRWASKIPVALTPFTISVAVISWFTHALLVLNAVLCIWFPGLLFYFFSALLLKLISEFLLLNSLSKFFQKKSLLWLFIPAQAFYWVYITVIGIRAPFGKYSWKGRWVK